MTTDLHATPALPTRALRRIEYDALVERGLLDDENVELLEGAIVYAAEEGPDHAWTHRRLARWLFDAIRAGDGEIGIGNPFAATDVSEPDPTWRCSRPACTGGGTPPARR